MRILLIGGESEFHEEFRAILCVDQRTDDGVPPDTSKPWSASLLGDLEIDSAGDGVEGLTRLRGAFQVGRPYVLAVVDLQPQGDWDGAEMARRLWDEDRDLPVLLVTPEGCSAGERRRVIRRLGHLDRFLFLSRPLDADEVRQMVISQTDRRLARDELQEVTGKLGRALQRAQQQAEAAQRAKSEFIANISHEIRTPMNAILGFTRLLMKEPLNTDQLEKLHYVRDAGQSLLSLLDNVLDYSKLAAGQLELAPGAFNLDAVLSDVLEATRPAASDKRLEVQHHVVGAVPRWLHGDKPRLRQVLVNLVNNAIKFTDDGSIHIHISLDEQTEQTATLRIVVTDTGVGIPVERQAIVFESFSQADGSSTRQFAGVGLGLSICKQLVDLMGGQIGFRSAPGRGSSFWMTLTLTKARDQDIHGNVHGPLRDPTAPTAQAACDTNRPAATRSGRPHVLVAEDDHLNRTLAEMFLTRAGCLVDLAENGEEALGMVARTPYDMVLMDVEMPKMDGVEAIQQIRRRETASGQHVPIIVLTAYDSPKNRRRCLAAGADDYLGKPFAPEMLIGSLRRCLPGRLEAFDEETPTRRTDDGPAEGPETLDDRLHTLLDARRENNFPAIEHSAATMRSVAMRVGADSVADHAMRVQLAARSNDLGQVDAAIRRLQSARADRPASPAKPNKLPNPCA